MSKTKRRKRIRHEALHEDNWSSFTVGQDAEVLVMPIASEIQEKMPTETETFVDRGVIELIIKTLNDYIRDRSHREATESNKG